MANPNDPSLVLGPQAKPTAAPTSIVPASAKPPTISTPKNEDLAGNVFGQLGDALFGKGNGSALGGLPVVGDLGRFVGEVTSPIAKAIPSEFKPVEAGVAAVSRVPLGWLPGQTDDTFRYVGDWMKQNDPTAYLDWQKVDAAAGKDFLFGANLKSDFIREKMTAYANMTKEGIQGPLAGSPQLAFGMAGSLGGVLSDLIVGSGLAGQAVQRAAIEQTTSRTTATPQAPAPLDANLRINEIRQRQAQGLELNDIEKTVLRQLDSGQWSTEHALNYLIAAHQGMSRDFLPQMLADIGTDPLTYLTLGASSLASAGKEGIILGRAAAEGAQLTKLEAAKVALAGVQQGPLKPVWLVARASFDPLTLVGKMVPNRAVVDLITASSTKAIERAYGSVAYNSAFRLMSDLGLGTEFSNAVGLYSGNIARKFVVLGHRTAMLGTPAEGEQLAHVAPDTIVESMMRNQEADVVTRLTDYATRVKKVFVNAQDDAQLAQRLAHSYGGDTATWAERVGRMSADEKSLFHAATYSTSWTRLQNAINTVQDYAGNLKLGRIALLNDSNLDNVAAQIHRETLQGLKKGTEFQTYWNDLANKYSDIADLGRATGSHADQNALLDKLDHLISSGRLHTRITPDELTDPALKPLKDFLDGANIDGQQVWNLGFVPDTVDAWGFTRDLAEGKLRVYSDPFVSNVSEWAPATTPIAQRVRNVIGQTIGETAGNAAGSAVDAMEVAYKTATDVISSQRLLDNMQQRFVRSMGSLPVPVGPKVAKDMWRAAREQAELQRTTIQGVKPQPVWQAILEVIPEDMRNVVTERDVMNSLIDASGGDLRIMGITSGLTQRVRTNIFAHGYDPQNLMGELTVNLYRTLRYTLNPTFYIQKVTDGAYFNILAGIHPVGYKPFKVGTKEWVQENVLNRIGSTSMARDFSLDMREYQFLSTFQENLRTLVGSSADATRAEQLVRAGSFWQLNNMVANFGARIGEIVDSSLQQAKREMELLANDPNLSPAMQAEAANAAASMDSSISSLIARYSATAGRTLTPNEAGLKYLQEIYRDSLAQTITQDGLAEFRNYIKEGTYHKPNRVGEVQSLRPNYLAADMGFMGEGGVGDYKALRDAVMNNKNGWSLDKFKEVLKNDFNASDEYIQRAARMVTFDYNDFWRETATMLDLTRQETFTLQGILAREAKMRGMGPAEYLSEVLDLNLGRVKSTDYISKILKVVKGGMRGSPKQQAQALSDIFIHSLDPSGQRVILHQFRDALPDLIKQARKLGTPEGNAAAAEYEKTLQALEGLYDNAAHDALNTVPETFDQYLAKYPPESISYHYMGRSTDPMRAEGDVARTVYMANGLGDGLLSLPEEQQKLIIGTISKIREMFPDVPLKHIDVMDDFALPIDQGGYGFKSNWAAITINYGTGDTAILFNNGKMANGVPWGPGHEAYWMGSDLSNDQFRRTTNEYLTAHGQSARQSPMGTPFTAGNGPMSIVYHEMGHAVDEHIRNLAGRIEPNMSAAQLKRVAKYQAYVDGVQSMYEDKYLVGWISEYAHTNPEEFSAELFNLAYLPGSRRDLKDAPFFVKEAITEYKKLMRATGVYQPRRVPDISALDAAATKQASDHFMEQVIQRAQTGKAAVDPNVESVYGWFAKWMKDVYSEEFTRNRTKIGDLLRGIMDGVPTNNAVPYHRSEALVEQLLKQKIDFAQRDAFRLAEMSTQRTMLSRSLNHPVFGLYPTSYMWGKVLPEMTKFIALQPFGHETGLLAYQMMRAEQSIATQREYDPRFATAWDNLAGSETAFLADYLTPSLPWSDMRAGYPPFITNLGKTGLDPQKLLESQFSMEDYKRWWRSGFQSGREIVDFAQHAPEMLMDKQKPAVNQQVQSLVVPSNVRTQATPSGQQATVPPVAGQLQPELVDSLTQLEQLFR